MKKLGSLKEESIFDCSCITGLIVTSNSVSKNPESEAGSEIKGFKTHLLNVLPPQIHSTLNGSLILDE